jgi:hypothetical protein
LGGQAKNIYSSVAGLCTPAILHSPTLLCMHVTWNSEFDLSRTVAAPFRVGPQSPPINVESAPNFRLSEFHFSSVDAATVVESHITRRDRCSSHQPFCSFPMTSVSFFK